MDANAQPDKLAVLTAEEVLRAIYGDDFTGCTVSLESVAAIIDTAIKQNASHDRNMIDMYEKVIEALHVLSTPPDPAKVTGPDQLRSLLSERLDAIHTVAIKTIETTERVKAERAGGGSGPSGV